LNSLTDLLERGRDTLYIDEYILANFRNYVHHENMDSSKAGKTEGKKDYDNIIATKFLDTEYNKKHPEYMVGEVEYILAGNLNQYANVAYVSGEIMLVRTAFNMGAMFTDASMYQQASSMVSVSGPFAPLATFALMVAWAVAESALDTIAIMSGEKVWLFKRGKDWELSVQGAIQNAVGAAFDFAATAIEGVTAELADVAMNYLNQVETNYNSAIYDYYVESENLSNNVSKITNGLDQISGGATSKVNSEVQGLIGIANSSVSEADSYVQELGNQKDATIAKLSEQYKEKKTALKNKVVNSVESFPTPEIAYNTGSSGVNDTFKVKLGYTDYLRLLLLLENSEKKMQRVQQVIQINMIKGEGKKDFRMTNSYVNVWADATVSIKYLFMSEAIVPADIRKDGRYQFAIHTNRSY